MDYKQQKSVTITSKPTQSRLKLKPRVLKVLTLLVCIPFVLWMTRIIRIWIYIRRDVPADITRFPKPHFPSVTTKKPTPEHFHDSYYCNVDCRFGVPCEYRDEVAFRVIVMTFDRASSLEKCLRALYDLDTLGDTMSIEIWADLLPDKTISEDVTETAMTFMREINSFKNKRACFHKQKGRANIGGQWVDTWRPKEDTEELGLILEDDVIVSKHAYRWVKNNLFTSGYLTCTLISIGKQGYGLNDNLLGNQLPKSFTPVDGQSDRTVESDTNIYCIRFLFKSINAYVNTFLLLVFYTVVVWLYFISTLINKNVSDTIYIGVREDCPVRFTVHGCNVVI